MCEVRSTMTRSVRTSYFLLRTSLLLLPVLLAAVTASAAAEHYGRVSFRGVPVPGASVTANQGDRHLETVTDQDGVLRFAALADGTWTIRVEMIGFAPLSQEIAIAAGTPNSTWELKLLPLAELTRISVDRVL